MPDDLLRLTTGDLILSWFVASWYVDITEASECLSFSPLLSGLLEAISFSFFRLHHHEDQVLFVPSRPISAQFFLCFFVFFPSFPKPFPAPFLSHN